LKRTIVVPLILLLSLTSFFEALPITGFAAASPVWSSGGQLLTSAGINQEPAALQASDGTIWLAWSQHSKTTSQDKLYYRTMIRSGGVWANSTSTLLTTNTKEITPSLGQLDRNTIILVWAENQTRYYHLVYEEYSLGNQTWSSSFNITTSAASDTFPSVAVARNGTSWLFWNRQVGNDTQIYYKTLTNGAWSGETKLTSGPNVNLYPSATIGRDGRVMLAYSSGSGGAYQIMYNTYTTGWGVPQPATPLSTSGNSDKHPAIVQDRNGTSWLFWERVIQITTTLFTFKIFGKSDANYGQNWITDSENQLTNDAQQVTDQHPAAIQSVRDKSVWVVYSTNIANNGEFDLYVLKAIIAPVHDVLVLGLTISPATCLIGITFVCFNVNPLLIYAGGYTNNFAVCPGPPIFGCPVNESPNVTVVVILWNRGDFNETVSLSLKATASSTQPISTQTATVLAGNQTYVSINWNTNTVRPARYGFSVNATLPLSEQTAFNKPDGLYSISNQVHLLPLGDVEQDGAVTITDVSIILYDYGFSCYNVIACSPRYIAAQYGDANGSGIIDIVDVGVVINNFGIIT
jgi:hypothetical protein